jgi:putative endopeptidase
MKYQMYKPLAFCIGLVVASSAGAATATGDMNSTLNPAEFDKNSTPCQNLFEYVNVNWLKAHPIPADRTSWGAFEMLDERSLIAQHEIAENAAKAKNTPGSIEQKVGDFYASGLDEAAVEKAGFTPIKDDLKRIDGLNSPDEIADFVRDYGAQGMPFVFFFNSQPDFHDSQRSVGYAHQGGLGLPERDYYFKTDANSQKIRAAYVLHIQHLLELVGIKPDEAATQAAAVMDLETKLADASLPIVELRNPLNQYHFLEFAEADKTTPHFAWEKYFAAQSISGEKGFSLSQPKFFVAMDKLMGEAPADQWRAYFRFHMIAQAAPYLSKPFVDEDFAFSGQTLHGQKEQKVRWKRVLESVDRQLGMALGQMYVAHNFTPESKVRAQELVTNLRAALKARIQNVDWMSDTTKAKAIEKWDSFMPKIGYPDKWRDWSGLNISHSGYMANVRAALKFNQAWRMGKVGKPVDRTEWGMTPQTVNAYYSPSQNEIVFPAAILQPPFFDAKADDALNYGGIGAVIGHEMTHGYDDQGAQFDAQGNFKNWWTDDDKKQFESRTDKLAKQFDEYVAIDDLHVHGKQTLGENIADLGGLNVAFDALQKALAANPAEAGKKIDGYTQDQRFYLNFGRIWARSFKPEELKLRLNTDVHAPAQFRAIAAPSNMPAFAKAFQCKDTDAMVRAQDRRVKIW